MLRRGALSLRWPPGRFGQPFTTCVGDSFSGARDRRARPARGVRQADLGLPRSRGSKEPVPRCAPARRLPLALAALVPLAVACGSAKPEAGGMRAGGDWPMFGYSAARPGSGPAATGITAANVRTLERQRVRLDGTVDSSPIYLRAVPVRGARRDVFVVTTSYGKTLAIDADSGAVLWRFTPAGYGSWVGSYRITNATPLADPSRRFVYAVSPDGRIHKLSLASGAEVRSGSWPATITRYPVREKIAPALNYARGLVLAATGGYIGDAPPYQGHLGAISARSGRVAHVWNSL